MTYAGGLAALLAASWLLFRHRYQIADIFTRNAEAIRVDSRPVERVPVAARAQDLFTDSLISAWVVICIYGLLLMLLPSVDLNTGDLLITLVPMAAACAALQRWRWSRNALMGISALILCDAGCAAMRLARVHDSPFPKMLVHPKLWQVVLSGFSGTPWFGAGVVTLAVVTMLWLPRPSVRATFEYRKRAKTRRCQLGIAAVLIAAYCCGLSVSGLSRNLDIQPIIAAAPGQPLERIALRPGALRRRVEQR
jgi:hypothetical protein